ncbi:MAG: hypothetical protein Q9225_007413, partial [Loekoesia sp. 1 TL-2023]
MAPTTIATTDDAMAPMESINSQQQPDDLSTVGYQSPAEIKASKLKVTWTKIMAEGKWSKSPAYKQVAVLLLSWHTDSDDLNPEDEVQDLQKVFKEEFGYHTTIAHLEGRDPARSVQVQVNAQVAGFTVQHDGPENLLIVYYAGHGTPSEENRHLVLFGKTSPNMSSKEKNRNRIIWNKTEALLKDAKADVLEIFDCCYAGALVQRGDDQFVSIIQRCISAYETRLFEFLAATDQLSITAAPGPNSFTRALIFALKHLVKDKEQGPFTTDELLRKIKTYPDFPQHQEPVLSDRRYLTNKAGRIMLRPLRPKGRIAQAKTENESLHRALNGQRMTLHFDFSSEIEERHLHILGTTLTGMVERNTLGVRHIEWGGVSETPLGRVANELRMRLEKRHSSAKKPDKSNLTRQKLHDASIERLGRRVMVRPLSPTGTGNEKPLEVDAMEQVNDSQSDSSETASIDSFAGSDTSETSTSSSASDTLEAAVEEAAEVFMGDEELHNLLIEAFIVYDRDKISRNGVRLLKWLGRRLMVTANTSTEKEVARFFLSRRLDQAIMNIIARVMESKPLNEGRPGQTGERQRESSTRQQRLETYLQQIPNDIEIEPPNDSEDEQKETARLDVSAMRSNLISSDAFARFKEEFNDFINPFTSEAMWKKKLWIGETQISFQLPDTDPRISMVDKFKYTLEKGLSMLILWWPFKQPRENLRPDK